jgi:hypothetical protein
MKSKSTKTTAVNLETRFDAGKDVTDYFDFSRPVLWGGARAGAGRKKLGKVRKQVTLSAAVARKVAKVAARRLVEVKRPSA